jgi:UDP:flavonoid glycosyltransferase YjiC (YdhE family)
MSKFLLVWETGANLGHIGALLPVAIALRDRGHLVEFALQASGDMEKINAAHQFPCRPAPQLPVRPAAKRPLASYADMMLYLGYDVPASLYVTMQAWRKLYAEVQPDVAVLNAAPTAMLAARGMPFKTALYGNSFDLPPMTHPLPAFRSWVATPAQELLKKEEALLVSINAVLRRLGLEAVKQVSQLFQSDERLLCAMKELDHYPARPPEKYWGWKVATDGGQAFQWRGHTGHRVFAYIRIGEDRLRQMVAQIRNPDCEYAFFVPGTSAALCDELSDDNVRIFNHPLKVDDVVKTCSLAITHATIGTMTAFLLHGVQLLMLPIQLEQFMVGRRIAAQGYGLMCNIDDPALNMALPIQQMLRDTKFRNKAREFARKYGKEAEKIVPALVDRLCAVAAQTD